jgi:hypothetical protein
MDTAGLVLPFPTSLTMSPSTLPTADQGLNGISDETQVPPKYYREAEHRYWIFNKLQICCLVNCLVFLVVFSSIAV